MRSNTFFGLFDTGSVWIGGAHPRENQRLLNGISAASLFHRGRRRGKYRCCGKTPAYFSAAHYPTTTGPGTGSRCEIGREHVGTQDTNPTLVCSLLLIQNKCTIK